MKVEIVYLEHFVRVPFGEPLLAPSPPSKVVGRMPVRNYEYGYDAETQIFDDDCSRSIH